MNYSPRFAGAVSLDSLRKPAQAPASTTGAASAAAGRAGGAGAAGADGADGAATGADRAQAASYVLDVTEASFQAEVIDRSMTVPVVIDLWADWCGPCKQLSPVLEKLAAEGAGAWLLAKIDVDRNPRLATALGVQGIPAVKAIWQGGIVGEFTGAVPEAQVRGWIAELVSAVGASTGAPAGAAGEASGEPELDPAFIEAAAAFERGDYDAAERAYQAILANAPADAMAIGALAGVRLFKRAEKLDAAAARATAQASPDDADAQLTAADVDMLEGDLDAAFSRLVAFIARTSGADRDRARLHLLSLFDAAGPGDPSVAKARAALSRALF